MQLLIQSIPAWLEFVSLAFCIGSLTCLLWVFPSSASGTPAYTSVRDRLWPLLGSGITIIFVASLLDLLMRTSQMSGTPFPAACSLLPTVVLRTHYGSVWIIRIITLASLAVIVAVTRRRESRTILMCLLFLAAGIIMTESAAGHPSDKGDFRVPEFMDSLHFLSASVWGGGLLVLSTVILPGLEVRGDRQILASVASRFSTMAGVAVVILAITSIYNAWAYVGSIDGLFKSAYGRTALLKIILFFLIIQFGSYNHYVMVPLLEKEAGFRQEKKWRTTMEAMIGKLYVPLPFMQGNDASGRLKRSVRIEAILITGVLLCAALLRHETPARHLDHSRHSPPGPSSPHSTHDMK